MSGQQASRQRIRGTSIAVQEVARELRRKLTPPEKVLWANIRGKQVGGIRFRKQHPLGRFVLDFYASLHHLVVEVDGGIHEHQIERDAERDAFLQAYGLRVLRVSNEDVFNNMPKVRQLILEAAFAQPGLNAAW